MVLALLILAVKLRTAITPRAAAAIVSLLAVASFVAVWAVHGFRYVPSESPSWQMHLEQAPLARTVPMIATVTGWIDGYRLLPNAFTEGFLIFAQSMLPPNHAFLDRKSTRLNSSHSSISYAVFCLKKKKRHG